MNGQDITSDFRLELTIPSERIIGAARDVMTQYTPIVEQAIKEAQITMFDNDELKEKLKEQVKERTIGLLNEMLEKYIRLAVDSAFYHESRKLESAARDLIREKIDEVRGTGNK